MNDNFSRIALNLLTKKKPDDITRHTKNRVSRVPVDAFVSEWKHDLSLLGTPCTRCKETTDHYFSVHLGNIRFILCGKCYSESIAEVISL